jgi:sphingosine-1-phosphate phosphatase 2
LLLEDGEKVFDMDVLFGTEVIEALQSALSPTLDLLFIFFTLLGEDYVYMSIIAITYWCFSKRAAVHMSYVLLASAYLNYWMKMSFSMDKPPSEHRIILKDDMSYGFPSGHAQNAATFWGWVGLKNKKAWMRVLFFTLIFLISLSRIYLGVHYLGDVLGGLIFGAVFLIIIYKTVPYLESKSSSIPRSLRDYLIPLVSVLLFGLSLAVFSDINRGDSALICGTLFGFSFGVSLESKHVNISTDVNWRTRATRSVIGLVTVFGLYLIISFVLIFLSLDALVYMQFLKYAIVAFAIVLVTPIIFARASL